LGVKSLINYLDGREMEEQNTRVIITSAVTRVFKSRVVRSSGYEVNMGTTSLKLNVIRGREECNRPRHYDGVNSNRVWGWGLNIHLSG
jgi:hypothetical protein